MSDSHTPGTLWIVGDDEHAGGIPFIEIASGECPSPSFKGVCEVCCTVPDEGDFFLSDEDRANARRIVAAWNACAGIETEVLEKGTVEAAKWFVKHTDTMNEIVQLGMARDEAVERTTEAERLLREAKFLLSSLLKAISLGPLDVAAMYGPDVHPDQPVLDAAENARAFLDKSGGKP